MKRAPILGQVDPDLACAVALGLVEWPRVEVRLEAITVHDTEMRVVGTVSDWLTPEDALDAATHTYLSARREAGLTTMRRPGQAPWVAAAAIKTRDLANKRAVEARDLGRALLIERGVLEHAREAGLTVLGEVGPQ
jgi:hypothetical protein